jgi:hypothetical protein
MFGRASRKGLFRRSLAPLKRLWILCFSLKNGFFSKTFGRAFLEEPELESEGVLPNRPEMTHQAKGLRTKK